MIDNSPMKLKANIENKKIQLSFTILNKNYYLLNSAQKRNKENYKSPMISNNENNHNSAKKKKKIFRFKELNLNNVFQKVNIKYRNKNESLKDSNNKFDLFFKTKKKIYRYNSCRFNTKDKNGILKSAKKIKNPLVITPLSKFNRNLNKTNKNKRNKLKNLKRNFTYKTFDEKDRKKINRDYILTNSMRKNEINSINNKKNEGTQITNDYFQYGNFINKKTYSIIRAKYCSPKSIIFQRQIK